MKTNRFYKIFLIYMTALTAMFLLTMGLILSVGLRTAKIPLDGGVPSSRGGVVQTASAAPEIWDGTVATSFAGGTGTEQDPYRISNGNQLAYLGAVINSDTADMENDGSFGDSDKYYILLCDIILNDTSNWGNWKKGGVTVIELNSWTPIGICIDYIDCSKTFEANFDGGGHAVYGIYINTVTDHQGLFGYVHNGEIRNIGVEQSYINGRFNIGGVAGSVHGGGSVMNSYNKGIIVGSESNIGGVAGDVSDGNITNCYNAGEVTWTNVGSNIGGVAGRVGDSYSVGISIVNGCHNIGTVKGGNNIGGVTGFVNSISSVINCYNAGDVSGGGSVGGIAGWGDGSITNCYNIGAVTGGASAGGVMGNTSGTITNCYNTGIVTGGIYDGGVAGYAVWYGNAVNCYYLAGSAGNGIGYTDDKLTSIDIFKFNANGDFDDNGPNNYVAINDTDYFTLLDALNAWIMINQIDPETYFEWQQPDDMPYPAFIWDVGTGDEPAVCPDCGNDPCTCGGGDMGNTDDTSNIDDTNNDSTNNTDNHSSCNGGNNAAIDGIIIAILGFVLLRRRK